MEFAAGNISQNLNDLRVSFDVFCDFIPIVSTISMVIGLAQKYLYVSEMEANQSLNANRYYTHLKNKDFQFSWLYVPFANFFFAIKLHCCSSTDEKMVISTGEEKLEHVDSLQIDTKPEEKKDATQPLKEPEIAKSSNPSTPSVSEAKESKAKAPVVAVNEILPRILSYFYASNEETEIVEKCKKNSEYFHSLSNNYLLHRVPISGGQGTVRINDLQFKLPLSSISLVELAFYFVLTDQFKGCKIESAGTMASVVVCFKTNISASDTDFYTKELLLQIDEVISKFPPKENFPKQHFEIEKIYKQIKQDCFKYLANRSFGTAESGLKLNTYYDLNALDEANLKFLVDSNVIKSWENSSSYVTLTVN